MNLFNILKFPTKEAYCTRLRGLKCADSVLHVSDDAQTTTYGRYAGLTDMEEQVNDCFDDQ